MKQVWIIGLFLLTTTTEAAVTRTKLAPAKPTQLESEIRAIPNFPQRGLSVYGTPGGGAFVYYDDTSVPLTTGQVTALDAVIAAHVPDFSLENSQAVAQTELNTNPICQATLTTVNSTLVLNLTTLQNLARCLVAQRQQQGAVKQ